MVPNLRIIGLCDRGTLRRVRLCLTTQYLDQEVICESLEIISYQKILWPLKPQGKGGEPWSLRLTALKQILILWKSSVLASFSSCSRWELNRSLCMSLRSNLGCRSYSRKLYFRKSWSLSSAKQKLLLPVLKPWLLWVWSFSFCSFLSLSWFVCPSD